MLDQLKELEEAFGNELNQVSSLAEATNLKADFFGKKGKLSTLLKGVKSLPPEERKGFGMRANALKDNLQERLTDKIAQIERTAMDEALKKEWTDTTLSDSLTIQSGHGGGLHPITLIQEELEDIFLSMGFEILDGPHIEDEYHNFEALNIPAHHPARDIQDTFWFHDMKHLLRTHTSPIQVRGMETRRPPFRFIAPGKTFRCEAIDASHEAVFHQLEGMMIGENITVANLIYFLKKLLEGIFRREVNIRLRPGYFPFVEPGFELDYMCFICKGTGCSVCKQTGWVEALGCGMVHPNVLRYGDIDPTQYSGFAFGLGIDRLAMMRYHIDDIRHIHSGDIRFGGQFAFF